MSHEPRDLLEVQWGLISLEEIAALEGAPAELTPLPKPSLYQVSLSTQSWQPTFADIYSMEELLKGIFNN